MIRSSIDLTRKRELVFLSDLVAAVRSALPKTDMLLVGAMARDLLLFHAHGIKAARATEDIDLAFAVADWPSFDSLRKSLLGSDAFHPHPRAIHKLLYGPDTIVDLIPFDGLENPDGTISWPPHGDTVMSVLGFKEALYSSVGVLLPSARQIAVVSLPMLAVLKIVAWLERRTVVPRKDAFDLLLILHNYLDAGNSERLYREAGQLLEYPGFDYERAGAWLAGKDALEIIQQYSPRATLIEERLRSLLAPETNPEGPLQLIGEARSDNPERSRQLLFAFLAGFSGMDRDTGYAPNR